MNQFLRDEKLDFMIKDFIDIFTSVEGVQLVRLSGLTKRAQKISGYNDLSSSTVDGIVRKLKNSLIINYQYIMYCPYCKEVTYQIEVRDYHLPKLCDSCNTIYNLINGETLEREEP